jgi:hypothetical protein
LAGNWFLLPLELVPATTFRLVSPLAVVRYMWGTPATQASLYKRIVIMYVCRMGNQPGIQQIPEIWETEEEKPLSIGQLKYKYLQFAREKYQGNVYTNKHTQNSIRVSRDGINEWWRKSRKREHIISVQLLNYFLENGIFIEENPDYRNRPEIEGASIYESACKVNGIPYKVILTIRKSVDNIAKFRYYTLKNVKLLQV